MYVVFFLIPSEGSLLQRLVGVVWRRLVPVNPYSSPLLPRLGSNAGNVALPTAMFDVYVEPAPEDGK